MQIGLLVMLIGIILFAIVIFPKKSKKSDTARLKQVMVDYIGSVNSSAPAEDIASAIIEASNEFNLSPVELLSIANQESRFNPDAVGGAGEIGMMQVLPDTIDWIEMRTGWHGDPHDVRYNVRLAAYYYNYCKNKARQRGYSGDMLIKKAFAYYNRGPGKDQDVDYWYVHQIWPIYTHLVTLFRSNGLANYV